ncbi:ICLN protein, partial [Chordeiles acutipennis]|nr:ICLN protein [Chordeiles acutipennis]
SRLSWLENSGVGFSLDYPSISLHAVSRDLSAYPWEHLYVMVNAKFEGRPGAFPHSPEQHDFFFKHRKFGCNFCSCSPIPLPLFDPPQLRSENQNLVFAELGQGDIPTFYTYEEGLSHLTAEGQATLERLEGMLAQSVSSQYNMAGVRTEDSIREFE